MLGDTPYMSPWALLALSVSAGSALVHTKRRRFPNPFVSTKDQLAPGVRETPLRLNRELTFRQRRARYTRGRV